MTETHDLRNQWYDEPIQYKTHMTPIEEVKAQIKVLEKKLPLLEEIENHKSPEEIAYKKLFGHYPIPGISWQSFKEGYKSAMKDWKVIKEETLYDVLLKEKFETYDINGFLNILNSFLMNKITDTFDSDEDGEEYITLTLKKSLLEVPND